MTQDLRFPAPSVPVDTSEAAADSLKPSVLNAMRLRVLAFIVIRDVVGATTEEVGAMLRLEGNTCRPRMVELEHLLLIERREGANAKRPTRSGRMARVYFATARGRGALLDPGSVPPAPRLSGPEREVLNAIRACNRAGVSPGDALVAFRTGRTPTDTRSRRAALVKKGVVRENARGGWEVVE